MRQDIGYFLKNHLPSICIKNETLWIPLINQVQWFNCHTTMEKTDLDIRDLWPWSMATRLTHVTFDPDTHYLYDRPKCPALYFWPCDPELCSMTLAFKLYLDAIRTSPYTKSPGPMNTSWHMKHIVLKKVQGHYRMWSREIIHLAVSVRQRSHTWTVWPTTLIFYMRVDLASFECRSSVIGNRPWSNWENCVLTSHFDIFKLVPKSGSKVKVTGQG